MALFLQDGTPLLLQNGEELLLQSDNLAVLGPNDQTVGDEQFATFEVIAVSNDPGSLTYQWYEETAGLLVGETAAVLTFVTDYTTDNGLVYYCIVTDSSGTIESAHATLTVTQKQLVWLQEPSDESRIEGEEVTFLASADGHPTVTYQWYDGVGILVGETGTSLTIQTSLTDNGRSFYCEATDGYSVVWTSATGVLTVVEQQGTDPHVIKIKNPTGQWITLQLGLLQYGAIEQNVDAALTDIGLAYQVLPTNNSLLSAPRGIVQDSANDGLRFSHPGVYRMSMTLTIEHNISASVARYFNIRLYNATDATAEGSGLIVGVGRSDEVSTFSVSWLTEVTESDVGDLFQMEIGNAATSITGVTLKYFRVEANAVSELLE